MRLSCFAIAPNHRKQRQDPKHTSSKIASSNASFSKAQTPYTMPRKESISPLLARDHAWHGLVTELALSGLLAALV